MPLAAYEFNRTRGLAVVGERNFWTTTRAGQRYAVVVVTVIIVVIAEFYGRDTVTAVVGTTTTATGHRRVGASIKRARIVIVRLAVIAAVLFVAVIVVSVRVVLGCVSAAAAAVTVTAVETSVIAAVIVRWRRPRVVIRFWRAPVIVRATSTVVVGRVRRWRRNVVVVVLVEVRMRGILVTVTAAVVVRRFQFVHDVADFVHQASVRGDVQVHPGFDDFLAVLVFADLEREQRVHADQAQVQSVAAPQGMAVRVDRRVGTVRADRVRTAAGW